MLKALSLAALLLAGASIAGVAQASPAVSRPLPVTPSRPLVDLVTDVVFAQPSGANTPHVLLKMDVLRPKSDKTLPAVVFITGGGFVSAVKSSYIQQRVAISEAGYVVVSIEYRVPPNATFPGPLEDVKSAIRYLRANAAAYGVDPDRIAVMGESAGGYLAAFAGVTNGNALFDKGDNLDQRSDVKAVVDLYGLSDLTRVAEGFPEDIQAKHRGASAPEALWVNGLALFGDGGSIGEHPEAATAANPIHYVTNKAPPFLLMHGDHDALVSPRQSERLHEALIASGVDSTRYVLPGAEHGGVYWVQPQVLKVIIDFLDAHLNK
ncbi:MAG: alpha/beta hydrolase [Oxalobacteraceae bacterium]|nr:MAG: alpha/beta hydrolase [Oxalobacteraceae bacterium]